MFCILNKLICMIDIFFKKIKSWSALLFFPTICCEGWFPFSGAFLVPADPEVFYPSGHMGQVAAFYSDFQFTSVQLPSRVQLFATP